MLLTTTIGLFLLVILLGVLLAINYNGQQELLKQQAAEAGLRDSLLSQVFLLEQEISTTRNQLQVALQDSNALKILNDRVQRGELMTIDQATEKTKTAVKTSRSVLHGNALQQLVPFLEDTNPSDWKFLGNPVDFVVFDGLGDVLNGTGPLRGITFVEVKTGRSSTSKSQKAIRDWLAANPVTFKTVKHKGVIDDE